MPEKADFLEPVTIVTQSVSGNLVRKLAAEVGFQLAGVTGGSVAPDFDRFRDWAERGLAGEMRYLTDHRADVRANPQNLLPGARSIVCVGLHYGDALPPAGVARYAHGEDYHVVIRRRLEELAARLREHADFEWRACVDTAPILERSFASKAGLGWIGKNTCLINQERGSYFLLGELLTTLEIDPDTPPPDRCGTCTRCIDACPTAAIVPSSQGRYELDARRCISYFTIELRGPIPEEHRSAIGHNVFGCDICQDVCPWNRREPPATGEAPLAELASLTPEEFRTRYRHTAVSRTKYSGFLRNVAIAMGNSGNEQFREPLERMAESEDAIVVEHAHWALNRLPAVNPVPSEPRT